MTDTNRWHITATFPWRYREAIAPVASLRLFDDAGCANLATATLRRDTRAAVAQGSDPVARGLDGTSSSPADPVAIVRGEAAAGCAGNERSGTAEAIIDTAPLLVVLFPRLRAPLARLREAL